MSMTKARKSLQDKLRSKFKWQTNANHNRGTILIKPNSCTHLYHDPKYVIDLAIKFDDRGLWRHLVGGCETGIEITQTKLDVLDDGSYVEKERLTSYVSPKELEIIYKILQEKMMEVCNEPR